MYKQVLVGVDAEEGGRDAIALARELVARDGNLTLAYVHAGYPLKGRGSSPGFETAERDRALGILELARSRADLRADVRCVGSTSVGQGLHVLGELIHSDLLVVGSTRRSLLGRVLIGDDTRSALEGAPCAVAIAPAGYAHHSIAMREIGVAYNGSPESELALELARGLASGNGAKLSVFETVELPTYAHLGGSIPVEALLNDLLDDARHRLATLGGVEPHVVYGQPSEELALYSASVDLLVIGSRGYGPAGRLVHGSTTRQLARTARCPLVVLTRPEPSSPMPVRTNGGEVSEPKRESSVTASV